VAAASQTRSGLTTRWQVGTLHTAPSGGMTASTSGSAAAQQETISQQRLIQVQKMIEECLKVYMSVDDICEALRVQHAVEPAHTRSIYAALKENSPEFFVVYELRLRIKEQIAAFNFVVAQQVLVQQQSGTIQNRQ